MCDTIVHDNEAQLCHTLVGRQTVTAHESIRRSRGLTISALARRIGYSHSVVSRVERGERSPSIRYRAAVAAALDVREADVFPEPPRYRRELPNGTREVTRPTDDLIRPRQGTNDEPLKDDDPVSAESFATHLGGWAAEHAPPE